MSSDQQSEQAEQKTEEQLDRERYLLALAQIKNAHEETELFTLTQFLIGAPPARVVVERTDSTVKPQSDGEKKGV